MEDSEIDTSFDFAFGGIELLFSTFFVLPMDNFYS